MTQLGRNQREILKLVKYFKDVSFTELVDLSSMNLYQVQQAVRPLVADGLLVYVYADDGRAVYRLSEKEKRRGRN